MIELNTCVFLLFFLVHDMGVSKNHIKIHDFGGPTPIFGNTRMLVHTRDSCRIFSKKNKNIKISHG